MSASGTPQKSPRHGPVPDAYATPRFASIPGSILEEEEDNSPVNARFTAPPDVIQGYGTTQSSAENTTGHRAHGSIDSDGPSGRKDGQDSQSGMPPISPQTTRLKKPPMARRASTKRNLPHRGDYFSVDDDPSEVEVDRIPPTPTTPSFTPILRQQSTIRRRTHQQVPQLPRVDSRSEEEEETPFRPPPDEEVDEIIADNVENVDEEELAEDGDDDLSDAESFTLRDRQLAINETHPFGIRIWKPALYKKNRSVEKGAEEDIHSSPSQIVSKWLWAFNCLWTVLFGWWLAIAAAFGAVVCFVFAFDPNAAAYGKVFWGLAGYLFWPFGKFVRLEQDENYVDEDEGEGRSISEYERWQSGDLEYGRLMFGPSLTHTGSIIGRHRNSIDSATENDSLLGRNGRREQSETGLSTKNKRRLFGRGQWTLGRVMFFIFFYFNIAPLMLLVSMICWLMVFWIPMGRSLLILFYHLRKRPLSLTFHRDASYARDSTRPSSILLCTYRAVGTKYWKYTIDGTNIFLINFLAIVVFVIFDYFVLKEALGLHTWLTSPALLFALALISVIPLAYFIGQAVASISAQSSMGLGAAVNAFFSTIVEVYLYCIALNEGKGKLVEGSIIGSIFAGILLLPGLSMCFGAIKRKTQRFNVKSAGATSTMLLFAVIAAFGPTLFYKIYGSHELICRSCSSSDVDEEPRDCRQCYFRQTPAINDDFFIQAVRPYCWFAALLLFSSYIIGLLFTLRTHAAVIWSIEVDEKRPPIPIPTGDVSPTDTRQQNSLSTSGQLPNQSGSFVPRTNIRDSQLYRKILGQSLGQAGIAGEGLEIFVDGETNHKSPSTSQRQGTDDHFKTDLPHVVPPRSGQEDEPETSPRLGPLVPGLSEEDNNSLVRRVAEMAATAATVAARHAVQNPKAASYQATHSQAVSKQDTLKRTLSKPSATRQNTGVDHSLANTVVEQPTQAATEGGSHDAPNWSKTKSSIVLLTATLAYAIVAEILVNTVDVVLESVDIEEKFLGITLFALVPNTTEFLNAISFAMNGNIALSMEIGSAYALQVCLLQIPALVLFSAVHGRFIDPNDLIDHTFNLIFPQWDMVTVILCVFLLSYMYSEGKSNYFKGSILVLTYLVVVMGFHWSGYTSMDIMGVDPGDTLAVIHSSAWQQRAASVSTARKFIRKAEL